MRHSRRRGGTPDRGARGRAGRRDRPHAAPLRRDRPRVPVGANSSRAPGLLDGRRGAAAPGAGLPAAGLRAARGRGRGRRPVRRRGRAPAPAARPAAGTAGPGRCDGCGYRRGSSPRGRHLVVSGGARSPCRDARPGSRRASPAALDKAVSTSRAGAPSRYASISARSLAFGSAEAAAATQSR